MKIFTVIVIIASYNRVNNPILKGAPGTALRLSSPADVLISLHIDLSQALNSASYIWDHYHYIWSHRDTIVHDIKTIEQVA
jgi:hypothetical protein